LICCRGQDFEQSRSHRRISMSTNNLTEESGFAIGDRTIDCQVLAVPFCGLTELCLRSPGRVAQLILARNRLEAMRLVW